MSTIESALDSIHENLRRLRTDYIDVVQIHVRTYGAADYEHIVNGGLLDALRSLKEAGKIGFIGITTEETLDGAFVNL